MGDDQEPTSRLCFYSAFMCKLSSASYHPLITEKYCVPSDGNRVFGCLHPGAVARYTLVERPDQPLVV